MSHMSFSTKAMVAGMRLLLLGAAVLSVSAAPMESCADQKGCMTWTVEPVVPGECDLPLRACDYKVCLTLKELLGCVKDFDTGTVSHTCLQAANQCSAPANEGAEFPRVPSGKVMCQRGAPGTTLTFILKDGNQCSGSASKFLQLGLTANCVPRPANIPTCTGNEVGKECAWTVKLPASCPTVACQPGQHLTAAGCLNDCVCEGGDPSTKPECDGETDCDTCTLPHHPVPDGDFTKCQEDCYCLNGDPKVADFCDGEHECVNCNPGWNLVNGLCEKHTSPDAPCTCTGGTPSDETNCHGQEKCASCDPGWTHTTGMLCVKDNAPCTCTGGTPSDETNCGGQEKCVDCHPGWTHTTGMLCVKDPGPVPPPQCTCKHGQPSLDVCSPGGEKCVSCDDNFKLDEETLTCVSVPIPSGSMPASVSDAYDHSLDNMEGGFRLSNPTTSSKPSASSFSYALWPIILGVAFVAHRFAQSMSVDRAQMTERHPLQAQELELQ